MKPGFRRKKRIRSHWIAFPGGAVRQPQDEEVVQYNKLKKQKFATKKTNRLKRDAVSLDGHRKSKPKYKYLNSLLNKMAKNIHTPSDEAEGKTGRRIKLNYSLQDVSQKVRERVWRYYKNNIPLSSIVQQINGIRAANEKVSLADCYMILYDGMRVTPPIVTQRRKFLELELKINEFVQVYNTWRSGEKFAKIVTQYPRCRTGVERLLKSLNVRLHSEARLVDAQLTKQAQQILSKACLANVNERAALVIYLDELSEHELSDIKIDKGSLEMELTAPDISSYANRKLMELSQPAGQTPATPPAPKRPDEPLDPIDLGHTVSVTLADYQKEKEELYDQRQAEEDLLANFPVETPEHLTPTQQAKRLAKTVANTAPDQELPTPAQPEPEIPISQRLSSLLDD